MKTKAKILTRFTRRMKWRSFFRGWKKLRPLAQIAIDGIRFYDKLEDLNDAESAQKDRYVESLLSDPSGPTHMILELLEQGDLSDPVQLRLAQGLVDIYRLSVRSQELILIAIQTGDTRVFCDDEGRTIGVGFGPLPGILRTKVAIVLETGKVTDPGALAALDEIVRE